MKYRIILPPEPLKAYVRYFSALDYEGSDIKSSQLRVFADRYPHLVFQHNNGNSAFFKNGDALPTAFMSGVKINPYICNVHNHSVVTITFYPQAIKQLFGIALHELNDEIVDAEHFVPLEMNDRLMHARDYREKIAILTDFLIKKIGDSQEADFLIREGIQLINDTDIDASISMLSEHFSISSRQLERRFKSATGLSPKLFLRTARFEKAIKLIKENNFENLSNIAFYLNYTDQSHFIKDFKEFSGFTPKVFFDQHQKTQGIIRDNGIVNINHLMTRG
jgi:AraC-like DNA-binding protein